MTIKYQFAFWNLENLFDIENSPRRSEKLQRTIGKELRGWSQERLDRKISQLASIISQLNGGRGPDLLGICEIENAYVMNLLVQAVSGLGRNYAIVHHDTSDQRGIDVGFIYDADRFTAEAQFSYFVMRRTATRDLFQVNFRTTKNRLLVVVGNHWPSRSGGQLESEVYRSVAGETLAYFHQRILDVCGKETPVLAMGDFNDEPFNQSLEKYALSQRSRMKVTKATNPCLYNLMWDVMGNGQGTHYFNNYPYVLDQFLANKNLIKGTAEIKAILDSIQIASLPGMTQSGSYPAPIPFGGMGKEINLNGFSDHFPITMEITEKE